MPLPAPVTIAVCRSLIAASSIAAANLASGAGEAQASRYRMNRLRSPLRASGATFSFT